MTATETTTEEALWAAIGAAPDDALPRLVLADWLEDRVGVVGCGNQNCKGAGGWSVVERKEFGGESRVWRTCPTCSGTGVVSNGHAETAEGLRATSDRVPRDLTHSQYADGFYWNRLSRPPSFNLASNVSDEVFMAMTGGEQDWSSPAEWRRYPTAAAAIKGLVRAWCKVHKGVRA